MDEQLTLFDTVGEPTVGTVTRAQQPGKVRYRRLTLCVRVLCDDCTLALQQAGWIGPAPLYAAWERIVGAAVTRLCHPHYEGARLIDRRTA